MLKKLQSLNEYNALTANRAGFEKAMADYYAFLKKKMPLLGDLTRAGFKQQYPVAFERMMED